MLLPKTCPACGKPGEAPCEPCRRELRPARSLLPPPLVDRCAALLDYSGVGREMVARLKYRNARSGLAFLADGMAAIVDPGSISVVTWVPTTNDRRAQRGFDQSELLARAVAARLGKPCRRLLRRLPGPAQTGRALAERRRGPPFVASSRRTPSGVLLVDDVVTTGATVTSAARTLRAAGVEHVQVVAAARTFPRGIHSAMARVRVCG